MTSSGFSDLAAAIADDQFPDVDLALRRGRHIGRDDAAAYEYLVDAQAVLEAFYRRFGCELVQQSDGYFYLLPAGDRLGRRRLTLGEMLVGQALALMYLDPASLQTGGLVPKDALVQRLAGLVGTDVLMRTLAPRKKRYDERIAAETVRGQIDEAIRRLAELGFVALADDDRLALRPALMRFAEPVRALTTPDAALAQLIARGEVVLGEPLTVDGEDDDDDAPSEDEVP